jgi:hypothetical protein
MPPAPLLDHANPVITVLGQQAGQHPTSLDLAMMMPWRRHLLGACSRGPRCPTAAGPELALDVITTPPPRSQPRPPRPAIKGHPQHYTPSQLPLHSPLPPQNPHRETSGRPSAAARRSGAHRLVTVTWRASGALPRQRSPSPSFPSCSPPSSRPNTPLLFIQVRRRPPATSPDREHLRRKRRREELWRTS